MMVELNKELPVGAKIPKNETIVMFIMAGLSFIERIILTMKDTLDVPPSAMAKEFITELLVCYGQRIESPPNTNLH
jgi:hypothetical protein